MSLPSLRDLIYRWMDDPEFWECEEFKKYHGYWQRWERDKICWTCIVLVQKTVLQIAATIVAHDTMKDYIDRFGIPTELGGFEKFLLNPVETEDFPPADLSLSSAK